MFQQFLNLFRHEAVGLLKRVPHPKDLYWKELGLGVYKRKHDWKIIAPLFIENQHRLNTCWAEAWANALAPYQGEQISVKWITGVAWFKKWCGINGAQLKVAGDVVRKRLVGTYGFLLEKEMPSDESVGWDEFVKVDIEGNIKTASPRAIGSYYFCETVNEVLQAIDEGYPVVIGRYWTNKFDDGFVLNPDRKANVAHATLIAGYDFRKGNGVTIEANSYSKDWGDKGFFYCPLDQLQKDIDTFGAIAITKIPYTPKMEKISFLQKQLSDLQNMLKSMQAQEQFYKTCKGLLGTTISWDDPKTIIDEQELGCGFAMTRVYNKAFPNKKVSYTGTGGWWEGMKKDKANFNEILDFKPCAILVFPTPAIPKQSPLSNGHIFVIGKNKAPDGSLWLMSNNSKTGKWDAHWTLKEALQHYKIDGMIPPFIFEVL